MKKIIETVLLSFVLFFGLSLFVLSNRVGGYRAFTVMSGSMEPSIATGSLVITKRIIPNELRVNDVITFIRPAKDREFITHRITDISTKQNLSVIKTKGDHNNSNDPWILAGGGVVGKVAYSVPYLGYLLSFTKTRVGITLFILIPALIIIYLEVTSIVELFTNKKKKFIQVSEPQVLAIMLLFGLISLSPLPQTYALLSDKTSLTGNKFTIAPKPNNSDCGDTSTLNISGNGADSSNTVTITGNCSISINQSNNTDVVNTINSQVSTGNNQSTGNTGSSVSVNTGTVTSSVSVSTNGSLNK